MIVASKLKVSNSNWWYQNIWYSSTILLQSKPITPHTQSDSIQRTLAALNSKGFNSPSAFYNPRYNKWKSAQVIFNSVYPRIDRRDGFQLERQITKLLDAIKESYDKSGRPSFNRSQTNYKLQILVAEESIEISKIQKTALREQLFQPKSVLTKLNQLEIPSAPNWKAEYKANKHLLPQYSDVVWRLTRTALPLGYKMQTWEEVNPHCQFGCNVLERFKHLFFDCPIANHQWKYFLQGWKQITTTNWDWHHILDIELPQLKNNYKRKFANVAKQGFALVDLGSKNVN